MVKRSSSSSPPPLSEDTKPVSSPRDRNKNKSDTSSTPKKPKVTTTTSSSNKESWDLEKKKIVAEMILEAGFKSTGLTTTQLRDALKNRHDGKTNLRSNLIKSIAPK
ncbi:hypothetical protein I302_104197 [Kwoniella bestiolae CBS 10118]|uniref:Uncharacterized protein n=1 Tax=Kwoniella bestiolae CBS 10118 TaxID=1296100 RepID=A0A1B9GAM5_9TREE|nr:hypothetical protein I302_02906 [Kwoniella bestiolae CBS 10118]OCF28055.1 hypothetical protein I302_02906 [Kwoniella bestiolae CBS 10118]